VELAQLQQGFLGTESVREGTGITVSYWKDQASILAWKQEAEHQSAQASGKKPLVSAL